MGGEFGLSPEEVAQRLTAKIEGKQNRYKWRKKIQSVSLSRSTSFAACPYTGNFLEDLQL